MELDIYFMIIYLCIKYESNTLICKKNRNENIFSKMKKGHNFHNNGRILPQIELDLCYMRLYTCVLNMKPIH